MTATQQRDEARILLETARQMGEAELRRDETVLRRILDEGLSFRRASGQIVGREEFLTDLRAPGNSFDCLESDVVEVTVFENTAIVVLVVRARGTRGGDHFEGRYRNIRLFIRDPEVNEGVWRCAMWLNTRIGAVGC